MQADNDLNFQETIVPALLYGYEIWTVNTDMKRRIDVFSTRCFCRIMGYQWDDFVSNQLLLHETESKPITSIVCQLP